MKSQPPASQNPVCPICAGSGWERSGPAEAVRRCACVDRARMGRLLAEARIPRRYQHCDLESYLPNDPSQKKAQLDVTRFLEKYPLIDVGLLFLGPCGVGKTHLAVAALKRVVLEKGDAGIFFDFRDLLREIQSSWNAEAQATEYEVLRPVLSAPLLVLDELGANKPTEWVRDTIAHIINCRYNEKKLTIFTSNYPDGATRPAEETLTDRIGVRLRSRLFEMCKVIEIRGKDFRHEIKQAAYRF
ncbi:MAG: DNA replication protein DnaC [Acidobacteria bacterium]|nr:DNA replication protein DnaC [Acidobacteriota bacterium]